MSCMFSFFFAFQAVSITNNFFIFFCDYDHCVLNKKKKKNTKMSLWTILIAHLLSLCFRSFKTLPVSIISEFLTLFTQKT